MQLAAFFQVMATVLSLSHGVPGGQWLLYTFDQGMMLNRTVVTVVRLGRHDFRGHVRGTHIQAREARFTRQMWLRHWLEDRLFEAGVATELEPNFEAIRML